MKKFFENISAWFGGLSPFVRNIIILGLFILFFIIVMMILNAIKKAGKEGDLNKEFNDDIKTLTEAGQKASYPDTTYKNLADKIEGASVGFVGGLGTDEESIIDVFKEMKNELDVVKLEKAFGAREPADCWAFCPAYALGAYLAYEMSAGNIAEINKILSDAGINMRF